MKESFIHYIWQFQYFDKTDLRTSEGEEIVVFNPGFLNTNAGPDFLQARVKIGALEWNGSVEIHPESSDWLKHRHDIDKGYDNVVLHVVWHHDGELKRTDGSIIPTLALKSRVDESLLLRYQQLMSSGVEIPCQRSFSGVADIVKLDAFEKSLMSRLEHKAAIVYSLHQKNNNDWEETTYQLLAKNFGFKINAEPFIQLARATPYKIIRKHRSDQIQLEALLFGQAGLLPVKSSDEYQVKIYNEYQFLRHKYDLVDSSLTIASWKFLRLRPTNFPTLRIAQFAAVLAYSEALFSKFMEADSVREFEQMLYQHPSTYWKTHYRFGAETSKVVPSFGADSFFNVVINTIVPLLVAYGKQKDDQRLIDRALLFLQALPAEENKIIRIWRKLGQPVKTAFDSQAAIEMYNEACQRKRCLSCAIGASLLKPTSR